MDISDLQGTGREELATTKLPDCRCETGVCEESCPYVGVWAPEGGIGKFFLTTQSIARQTEIDYTASTLYREEAGKWTASPLDKPLQRELDASSGGDLIVEAIPDAGCCGWVNESNDQTLVRASGKTRIVFDERASYKNPDYDVSFYTSNALLSPEVGYLAMTIETTAKADQPIQIADQGEANPEELQRIRKALAELPAVEVKSMRRVDQREGNSDRRGPSARGLQRGHWGAAEVECASGGCGAGVFAVSQIRPISFGQWWFYGCYNGSELRSRVRNYRRNSDSLLMRCFRRA